MGFNFFDGVPLPLKTTSNGVEVVRSPSSPVPDWIYKGVESFLTAGLCDLVGYQESFFRSLGADSLAHRAAMSRAAGGCYISPPNALSPSQPPRDFDGGQCTTGRYRGRYAAKFRDQAEVTAVWGNFVGPIVAVGIDRAAPNTNGRGYIEFGPSGRNYFVGGGSSPYLEYFKIIEVVRINSSGAIIADDCGSLPLPPVEYPDGIELPPPPLPGQELRPPEIVTVTVPVGDTNIDYGISVGPVTIDLDGRLSFDFGGIDISINPDFSVNIGDPIPSDPSLDEIEYRDRVESALDAIRDRLIALESDVSQVKDEFSRPLDGAISGGLCDGTDVTLDYSGGGFVGLANQVNVLSVVMSFLFQQFCSLLEGDEVLELVPLGSFGGQDNRRFFDIALPSDARVVYLDATTTTGAFAIAASGNDDTESVQARFAQVSFLVTEGTKRYALPAENQYYSRGVYLVPWRLHTIDMVRVCLYPRSRVVVSCLRKI